MKLYRTFLLITCGLVLIAANTPEESSFLGMLGGRSPGGIDSGVVDECGTAGCTNERCDGYLVPYGKLNYRMAYGGGIEYGTLEWMPIGQSDVIFIVDGITAYDEWYDANGGNFDCGFSEPVNVIAEQNTGGIDMELETGPRRIQWWEIAVSNGELYAGFDLYSGFDKHIESAVATGPNGFSYSFDLENNWFDWLTECSYMIAWSKTFGPNFDYGEYAINFNFIDGSQKSYSRILQPASPPPVDPDTANYTVNSDGSIEFSWAVPDPNGYYHLRIYGADGNRYYRSGTVQGLNNLIVSANDLRCLEKGQIYRFQIRSYDRPWPYNAYESTSLIDLVYDPAPFENRIAGVDVSSRAGGLDLWFDVRPGSRGHITRAAVTGPGGFFYQYILEDDWYDISTEYRRNKGWSKLWDQSFEFGEYTIEEPLLLTPLKSPLFGELSKRYESASLSWSLPDKLKLRFVFCVTARVIAFATGRFAEFTVPPVNSYVKAFRLFG